MTLPDIKPYLNLGWEVVPIVPGQKRPSVGGWSKLRVSKMGAEERDDLFDGQGVGLLLGKPSGGVVDVDLDVREAAMLANEVLSYRTLVLGRSLNPRSHYLYLCHDLAGRVITFDDPIDGKRMLELRGNGQQLLPPSIWRDERGVTEDRYEWVGDLREPTSVKGDYLRSDLYLLAMLTALARHWDEFETTRHDLWLGICGGLLRRTPSFWGQPGRLEGLSQMFGDVMDYHDTNMLVDSARTTIERHENGQPYKGWGSLFEMTHGHTEHQRLLTKMKEWAEEAFPYEENVEEEYEEKYEEAEYGIWSTRQVDLEALLKDEIPEPPAAVPGFLWENMEHTLIGEAGTGKTLLTCWLVVELAKQGKHSIWVDYQNGRYELGRRFQSMQVEPELLRYIHIIEYPEEPLTNPAALRDLQGLIEGTDARLLVFDSMMDVLSLARSEMNSADDYNTLHRTAIMPLRHTGRVALLTHDHSAKHDGSTSIGTSMKKNNVEVEWLLTNNGQPPSRMVGGAGLLLAQAQKARGVPIARKAAVSWEVEPCGPVTTDPATGQRFHRNVRIDLMGHYASKGLVPTPGLVVPRPGRPKM